MRAAEIQKCTVCGKHPLEALGAISFHLVTFDRALLDHKAARQVLGMAQYFGGLEHGPLAEVFAPDPHVVKVPPELRQQAVVCEECMESASLAQVWEAAGAPADEEVAL